MPVCENPAYLRARQQPVQVVRRRVADTRVARAVDFAPVQHVPLAVTSVRQRKGRGAPARPHRRSPNRARARARICSAGVRNKPRLSRLRRGHRTQNENSGPFANTGSNVCEPSPLFECASLPQPPHPRAAALPAVCFRVRRESAAIVAQPPESNAAPPPKRACPPLRPAPAPKTDRRRSRLSRAAGLRKRVIRSSPS